MTESISFAWEVVFVVLIYQSSFCDDFVGEVSMSAQVKMDENADSTSVWWWVLDWVA